MAEPPKHARGRPAVPVPVPDGGPTPERIGPYRVLRRIGEGGMGAVFLGHDDDAGRDAAIKVMLPKAAANPTSRERFLREGRAMAKIASPHVVAVYHVGEDNGVPYIAMEYLAGLSVEDRLKSADPIPLPEVVRIVVEAAAGLAAAHAPGLVHRDIKPSNLWLEVPSGRVKVLDFGLARDPLAETNITRAGAVLGTPAYMAPEQARGLPVDGRTDLFSLGVVAYHLVTGVSPFLGRNTVETLTRVVSEDPPPVRTLRPDVPEHLGRVIDRLIQKDPDGRFATAQEVAAALAPPPPPGFASATVFPPAPVAPPDPLADLTEVPRRPRRGSFPWTLVAVLVFVVGSGAMFYAAVTLDRTTPTGPTSRPTAPDPPTPPRSADPIPVVFDPGRPLADWAVRRGYAFRIGESGDLRDSATLPPGPAEVTAVVITGKILAVTADDRKFFRPPDAWTDGDLIATRNFPTAAKVRLVVVNSTGVTDTGVAALGTRTGVVYLDLRSTGVTDRGMAVVTKMPGLERLSVADTAVGNAGLDVLRQCPALRWVDLRGSRVTPDAVRLFRKDRPACDVLADARE